MVKFLIDRGTNLQLEDKKGMTPTHWAKKHNRPEIMNLLLEHGGAPITERRKPATSSHQAKPVVVEEAPKVRENERKVPRRYMLTMLREGGHYSPMSDAEFEDFKRQNPSLARYFELTEEGEDEVQTSEIAVPSVPESAPIFD